MSFKPLLFIADPGHAWLRVSRDDLRDLGMTVSDFSTCSYRDRHWYYLEEDCDAPKFMKAYKAKHGVDVQYTEHNVEKTFIRDLDSIRRVA